MDDAIFVAKLGVRWGRLGFGEDFIHAPLRIGIKHEELAGVGLRVAQEFEAVCFRTGERLFVAEDNPSRIVFELAGANKAAALAALVSTGQCIFLRVSVESRNIHCPVLTSAASAAALLSPANWKTIIDRKSTRRTP